MPQRTMPARRDNWRPVDRIYDGILERCVDEAERGGRRDGTAELMAGAVVVGVLAVVILVVAQSAAAALVVCGVLVAGLFAFIVGTAEHLSEISLFMCGCRRRLRRQMWSGAPRSWCASGCRS